MFGTSTDRAAVRLWVFSCSSANFLRHCGRDLIPNREKTSFRLQVGNSAKSEKLVALMDSKGKDIYLSRPCTSAGGLVASTAVKVSIIL
jgi:hypothetical protein